MNERFQNAIQRKPQQTPPVWFMRQAGRYHQHYQALRKKHSFMELCKNAELASEVALGPVQDFDFDVAILFSDLLFPLEALGLGLEYKDSGPELGRQLTAQNFSDLKSVDESVRFMEFQKEAMILTRKKIPKDKSVIGFVGGPWTLFTYAVEGGHKGSLQRAKANLFLYERFARSMVQFLKYNIQLQFDGGAEVVMVFDTAAGEVSPSVFQRFLAPHLLNLASEFPGRLGYYSKGTTLDHFSGAVRIQDGPWAGLGIDHRFTFPAQFSNFKKGFLQGNFDQAMLFLPEAQFRQELDLYLNAIHSVPAAERAGWVSGLGHGVLPQTPESHVKYFVQRVREVFK